MPGMLLKGGASALVGTGAAAQPPLTAQPAAATTAQTAGGIAFGPSATPGGPSAGAMFQAGGHSTVWWSGVIGLALLIWVYHTLPK